MNKFCNLTLASILKIDNFVYFINTIRKSMQKSKDFEVKLSHISDGLAFEHLHEKLILGI